MGNFEPEDGGVAAAIRVSLARKNFTQGALATPLQLSQPAIHRRMTGKVPWRVGELTRVAEFLGVGVAELLPDDADATEQSEASA